MPKVQITFPPPGGAGSLVVNGVDLTDIISRDGLSIDFTTNPPQVIARLIAPTLEVTLPDGVVVLDVQPDP